jgi:isopropylmalate/homocitrate/citramalate synthase
MPFKTDRWFVSPWNYTTEVTSESDFPEQIKIHDVSLRDGEQQAGLIFTKDEKIRIAEALAEAGVHRIEAGMPAVSKQDEEAIRDLAKRNLEGTQIFAFSRCMIDDVKRASDCGVHGIIVEIPCSEHIIEYAYQWPLEKALNLAIEATQFASQQGLYTVFFPIDASRAEMKWFLDTIEKVATEGHMDALGLVDTFGGLSPSAVKYMVKKTKERINKPLEAHFHDDFGLGAANTILALEAGAEVAHTTITSIGERAGNAAYEDVVLSLLTMYGIDLGIKTEMFYEISKMIRDITGMKIPPNRPIVGENLFKIESGIITGWLLNCGREHALELAPFTGDLVGQFPPEPVLGKGSGLASIDLWLDKIGVEATAGQKEDILYEIKKHALEKKRLLEKNEFREIAERVLAQGDNNL